MKDFYTVNQAAQALGLSREAVIYRIRRGIILAQKIDNVLWVIPGHEVERVRGLGRLTPGRDSRPYTEFVANPPKRRGKPGAELRQRLAKGQDAEPEPQQ